MKYITSKVSWLKTIKSCSAGSALREILAVCADVSGRPDLRWKDKFSNELLPKECLQNI